MLAWWPFGVATLTVKLITGQQLYCIKKHVSFDKADQGDCLGLRRAVTYGRWDVQFSEYSGPIWQGGTMESPAAPATSLRQEPRAANGPYPATKHYRGALRYPVVRQLIRFTGVGIVCTLASLGLYALLRPWLGPQLANAAALIVTSVINTALNRRLTFKISGSRRRTQDHVKGMMVIAIALVLTGGSLGVLHWLKPEATVAEELWTTTVSGWLATAVRFFLLRHWIFRRARHI